MDDDRHALIMYGTRRMNWANRHSLAEGKEHLSTKGTGVKIHQSDAPGIHFGGFVGDAPKEIILFRVGDVTLENAFPLDWHGSHDTGVSPKGKRLPEALATHFLEDAITRNPGQADQLGNYRLRIRPRNF